MKKSIQSGNAVANSRLATLRAGAEASMSNYLGTVNSGQEFINSPSQGMSSMAGNSVNVKRGMQPIIIDIKNTDDLNDLIVPIFGKNESYLVPFNGVADKAGTVATAAKGIVITPKNYSYQELRELSVSPFTVVGMLYRFGDSTQLDNDWTIRQKDGSSITEEPYQPAIYQGLLNNVTDKLEDKEFFMPVTAGTTLFVKVSKAISASVARTLQITLFMGVKTDLSEALKGNSVLTGFHSK